MNELFNTFGMSACMPTHHTVGIFIYLYVLTNKMVDRKFNTASDLKLFRGLQKFGRMSLKKLGEKTGLPSSTVQYAMDRLKKRDFYDITARPKLEFFPELPLGLLSFANLDPLTVRRLKETYLDQDEIRGFITNGNELLIILMAESKEGLAELIFQIMKKADTMPMLHILSPNVLKLDLRIPDRILDSLYPGLSRKEK